MWLPPSCASNIGVLAERLELATRWALQYPSLKGFTIGYFGASTGAAAALVAASHLPEVAAIVSRGGRPDLAGPALNVVRAPTLLIVGGDDLQVLDLNRRALGQLPGEARLQVIPGATHLFEEPGALEQVAALALGWFQRFFTAASPRSPVGRDTASTPHS